MGLVLDGFAAMACHGQLVVQLPNGDTQTFGHQVNPVTATLIVRRYRFFTRLVLGGHVGAGEGYVAGDWDTPSVGHVVGWVLLNQDKAFLLEGSVAKRWGINLLGLGNRLLHALRANTLEKSPDNIQRHYDVGNAFFALLLDKTMTYSAALFAHPEQSLEDAQLAKYDALCRQLRLTPNDHVLEIGCGWGGFACYAARKYGCRVTGVTLSPSQLRYGQKWVEQLNLQEQVDLQLQDYRKLTGQFDKIVSTEMLEAVGDRYYETFFRQCDRLLKPGGLLALQVIVCPDSRFEVVRRNVDFIQKHIFPGSLLPSIGRLTQAMNRASRFSLVAVADMGLSYAETLRRWERNLNQHTELILAIDEGKRYDERFLRMWRYYLGYCKAAFATRNITVVQALLTRPNNRTLVPNLTEALKS